MSQRRIQSAQGRPAQSKAAPVTSQTVSPVDDFVYVTRDLKRIAIIAGGLILVMIALSFVL
jgi:hypothetical protein